MQNTNFLSKIIADTSRNAITGLQDKIVGNWKGSWYQAAIIFPA